jgi:glycosyltransferase involved in cell wall biosynthesis
MGGTFRGAHLALFVRSLAGGGAERSVHALAAGLAGRGHRVDLVLGRLTGDFARDLPQGVRCIDLGGPRWLRALPALLRQPDLAAALAPTLLGGGPPGVIACAPALADYLRCERPDALFSALIYANLAALWARRMAGTATRVVVSERNAIAARVAADPRRRTRRIPELIRRFYPEADAVACVSQGVADEVMSIAGLDAARVRACYNPVVTPALRAALASPPPHPWLEGDGPPVVLGVGKLKPQKGFDVLLRAFARLRAGRDARLVLLGRGPEEARLRALAEALGISGDVLLPGFAADPFAWMRHASVFALASRFEGLPGALIQAMACGCPVVSSDCDHGPREVLEGGRWGPLVPVDDDDALARALAAVLDQPPPADSLRGRAEAFGVAAAVDRTLPLLLGDAPPATSSSSATSRSATASTV